MGRFGSKDNEVLSDLDQLKAKVRGMTPKTCHGTLRLHRAETHYSILGVSPSSSTEELKKKFLELAEEHHPDKSSRVQRDEHDKYCQTERHEHCPVCKRLKRFTEVTMAYAILKDVKRRVFYDKQLKAAGTQCKNCAGAGTITKQGFRINSLKKTSCPMCEGTGQAALEVK